MVSSQAKQLVPTLYNKNFSGKLIYFYMDS